MFAPEIANVKGTLPPNAQMRWIICIERKRYESSNTILNTDSTISTSNKEESERIDKKQYYSVEDNEI